jgi:DNA-binding MarR family transcriptional regulator
LAIAAGEACANLLGALATALSDVSNAAVRQNLGSSNSAAAALSALNHFLDRPSIDVLSRIVGLTSSGTVRLVDRLEQSGYVRRRPGEDGRLTAVSLTTSGRRAAQRLATARDNALRDAIAGLEPSERRALAEIATKILIGISGDGAAGWICRFCDPGSCIQKRSGCPVANSG